MIHTQHIRGFTLIETMVAISLLTVAIVAPMSLTTQSLASAYYARDQVTASYLAQEAIEAIRSVRDGNILADSQGIAVDLLAGLPSTIGAPFTIDTRDNRMNACSTGVCPPLTTDGTFYAYGPVQTSDVYNAHDGWVATQFTRTITAKFVAGTTDEVRITVTVSWRSGGFQARSFTISENLYRWVNDGSGSDTGTTSPSPGGSQTFTASGSFTVPAYSSLTATCWGAGGGGGSSAGGLNGSAGGPSSFGSTLIAGGGSGGVSAWPNAVGADGAGGTASGGDSNIAGSPGISGAGGSAPSGGAGGARGNNGTGSAGSSPGGGGGGGDNGSLSLPGGGGGSGAYASKTYSTGAISGSVAVVIGTGGAAGNDCGGPGVVQCNNMRSGGGGARGECRIAWN